MTRLLRIFSEARLNAFAIAFGILCFSGSAPGATVTGEINIVSGGQRSSSQQVDLSDIVVWLQPVKPVPVPTSRARLLQKNKMFSPHVLVITVGTVVDFPNADPIFHSAFSNYNGQLFDLSLYPPGTTKSVRFRRPGIVRVFCNIHPTMSAVIVVLDTPYFTKANRDGSYQIANLPLGDYELHVFDERATAKTDEGIQLPVSDEVAQVQAPLVKVSEEGYVPSPHKNKYGLDYPVEKDSDKYGGVPR